MTRNKEIDSSKIVLDDAPKEPDALTIKEAKSLEQPKQSDSTRGALGVIGGGLVGIAAVPTIGALLIGGAIGLAIVKLFSEEESSEQ